MRLHVWCSVAAAGGSSDQLQRGAAAPKHGPCSEHKWALAKELSLRVAIQQ